MIFKYIFRLNTTQKNTRHIKNSAREKFLTSSFPSVDFPRTVNTKTILISNPFCLQTKPASQIPTFSLFVRRKVLCLLGGEKNNNLLGTVTVINDLNLDGGMSVSE